MLYESRVDYVKRDRRVGAAAPRCVREDRPLTITSTTISEQQRSIALTALLCLSIALALFFFSPIRLITRLMVSQFPMSQA